MVLANVLLPQPLSPTMETASPGYRSKSTPSRALTSPALKKPRRRISNHVCRLRTERIGFCVACSATGTSALLSISHLSCCCVQPALYTLAVLQLDGRRLLLAHLEPLRAPLREPAPRRRVDQTRRLTRDERQRLVHSQRRYAGHER